MRQYSEANERWVGFEHRAGDIVISTRSKCGTTWMQMICALLVHQTPDLPAPLAELSPWLDWRVEPIEVVRKRLDVQEHRRIIKTHTPLDGLPLHEDVTYIVVGRHPLDVAVSLWHHARNIDRDRMHELTGEISAAPTQRSVGEWLEAWIVDRSDPVEQLDTLSGNLHHVADAWERSQDGNVVLVHFADLERDLDGQMRRLAERIRCSIGADSWPSLIEAASFTSMRARGPDTVPDRLGVLSDPSAFFRAGRSGEGLSACTQEQRDRYFGRTRELASDDILTWMHHGSKRDAAR